MIVIRSIAAILFLIATIILSVLSLPVALIDRSGKTYLWLARLWSKIFLFLFGTRLHVTGLENIKGDANYVFVANHSSYADIPIILAGIPHDIRLILRKSLTRIPIWGWALLISPMIIIDRTNAARAKKTLSAAIDKIKEGASVLLFPEGTRSADGKLHEFKRGAFHIASESEANVIPVAIIGAFEMLPRTSQLPKWGAHVTLKIGKPLQVNAAITSERERELDLMRRAEESIREMLT